MVDRRADIIETGLAVLREHGFVGLTQPRIAKQMAMRQSLLTYYFPTRVDLLTAIARVAVDRQLAAVHGVFDALPTIRQAAAALAVLIVRHENTRVLMALAQAGDREPQLRSLFRELTDGIAKEVDAFLARTSTRPVAPNTARLLHATSVGLAIVTLATGQDDAQPQVEAILSDLLGALVSEDMSMPRSTSTALVRKEPS